MGSKAGCKKLIVVISVLLVFTLFCAYENNKIVVSTYSYSSNELTGFEGYKIVQISDLHNANFGISNSRLIQKVVSCEPDIVVITGDLVDSNHTNIARAEEFAREIANMYPVYFVTGNHELWLKQNQYSELVEGLENAGVNILSNELITIEKNGNYFNLVGIDDAYLIGNQLSIILEGHKNECNVVLAHEPQYIKSYEMAGADLVLAGHAHGGQFILPVIGAVYAPDQGFNPQYTEGQYKSSNMTMIVSRGLGNSVIPVRLFNYPEVVCVELKDY